MKAQSIYGGGQKRPLSSLVHTSSWKGLASSFGLLQICPKNATDVCNVNRNLTLSTASSSSSSYSSSSPSSSPSLLIASHSRHLLPHDLILALHRIFESNASSGTCLLRDLLDNILDKPLALTVNLVDTQNIDHVLIEIQKLKDKQHGHRHITFQDFKNLLLSETNLTILGFEEHMRVVETRRMEKLMYGELLRKTGVYNDDHFLDPFVKREKLEVLNNDGALRTKLSLISATRPSPSISARVEQKMQVARWEPRSKVDETSLDAIIAKLIGFRLEALTDEETDLVRAALSPPHNEIVLIEKFNTPITRHLIKCLANKEWLNDEIINFSMCMLQERDTKLCEIYTNRRSSHYFSSFFISKLLDSENKTYNYGNVKRWSKKFNTFEKDMIFCPVNLNNAHWTMLVMYIQQKKIQYYDSMGSTGARYLKGALQYLSDEAMKLGFKEFNEGEWQLVPSLRDIPQQENGYDCGAFSIMFADFLTDSLPLTFSQVNMPLFRKKICANVLRGSLKYQLISLPR